MNLVPFLLHQALLMSNDPSNPKSTHDHEDEADDLGGETAFGIDPNDPLASLTYDDELSPSSIDLVKVPRRLWEQTLAPLHRQHRYSIAHRITDERLQAIASNLAFKLDMEDSGRRNTRDVAHHTARRTGHPLPTPRAAHAVTRSGVQVNIRLRADDHARLAQAAGAVGMKPTTLARALVLNGAAAILREHGGSEPPGNRSPPNARLSLAV